MKLFAFLLVVLIGAAQAFVAPSAFKGTAMTSPRAARGEESVRIERVFRERCGAETLKRGLRFDSEAVCASTPSSLLRCSATVSSTRRLFVCVCVCVQVRASFAYHVSSSPCSVIGPLFAEINAEKMGRCQGRLLPLSWARGFVSRAPARGDLGKPSLGAGIGIGWQARDRTGLLPCPVLLSHPY